MTPTRENIQAHMDERAANYGLPEGVELIDFRAAGPNDFECVRHDGKFLIYQGSRNGAAQGARVQPAKGYQFVKIGEEQVADIKAFSVVLGRAMFTATKEMEPKTIEAHVAFVVRDELTMTKVQAAFDALKLVPGFARFRVD